MAKRLIDADKLKERLKTSPIFPDFGQDGFFIRDMVIDLVDNQRTVDVVEVVHGEWQSRMQNGQYGYYCSKCNTGFTGENAHWIAKEHLYCPRCGAKMDGESKVSDNA